MRFYNIFFSPTGGTAKVADIIAKGTKLDAKEIDLIKEPDMFRKVKADGTKTILATVFGNRAIDDTLLELHDVLEASGFVCIAGIEAVAEHSLSPSRMHRRKSDSICR